MDDGILIVRVAATGDIYKHPARYSAGNEWSFPIEYTLEDGRVFPGTATSRRLKDAKAELAALPQEPPRTAPRPSSTMASLSARASSTA